MGYMAEMMLMLTGVITTLEPNFPEASYSTLSVRGLNVLHAVADGAAHYSWTNKKDSDIAVDLGNMPLQAGHAGLGHQGQDESRQG